MIERKTAYIAGPYAAETPLQIERNVMRSVALGRLATEIGYAALVPHAIGWMGVYGERHEGDVGVRDRALSSSLALVEAVGRSGGALFVLERDDGSLSTGTGLELERFLGCTDHAGPVFRNSWEDWRVHFEGHGLAPLWSSS
jgi:hypothetical protein